MAVRKLSIIYTICLLAMMIFMYHLVKDKSVFYMEQRLDVKDEFPSRDKSDTVHVAMVACGDSLEETVTAMKSLFMFNPQGVYLHLVADDHMHDTLMFTLRRWRDNIISHGSHGYRMYPVNYSMLDAGYRETWKQMYRPCATQRLLLAEFLPVDTVIYIDIDTIIMGDLRPLWKTFRTFGPKQSVAMTDNLSDTLKLTESGKLLRTGEKTGLQTGVILMNLTRIRESRWMQDILGIYDRYKDYIIHADQCLLNIYREKQPDIFGTFPCNWHYCSEHCDGLKPCDEAEFDGLFLLHGNRRLFNNKPDHPMSKINHIFNQYEFSESHDSRIVIYQTIMRTLYREVKAARSDCAKRLLTGLKRSMRKLKAL